MLQPVLNARYSINAPLSHKEREENRRARRKGLPVPHSRLRGTFRFCGFEKNGKLRFRGTPTTEAGILYAGRMVRLDPSEFDIGVDLNRIRRVA